jgi:subtilisin
MNDRLNPSGPRPRWQSWTRIGTVVALAALALATGAPVVMGASAAPEIRIDPTTLYFGAASPPANSVVAGKAAELPPRPPIQIPQPIRDKAAAGGVRILVQLAAKFRPEGSLAQAQAQEQRQEIGRVQEAALGKLRSSKVRVNGQFEHIPFLALEVDASALDLLAKMPEVVSIQEDQVHKVFLASSNAVIGSGVAWSKGLTGAGQVIAVLDSGVDKTHPFFSSGGHNKIVSEACYSANVDDSYGYYATTSLCPGGADESTAAGSGVNCPTSIDDDCRHGTHVAGIAAGNDGVGPNFGVARDADLISIQVFSSSCNGSCIVSWESDQIKGLERVYALAGTYNIAAVNVSIGGYPYNTRSYCDQDNPAFKAAIDNLRSIDVATVAAAGNYGSYGISAPACISSAVSVSTTDDADQLPYFANLSRELDLMAPGVAVTSSVPGGGTAPFDGTSMSSPMVAGAFAVLRQANPSATVSDVRTLLRETSVQIGGFGWDLRRINLGKAVTAGPLQTKDFTLYNDGAAVLSVLSMQLETPASWIRVAPEAPFDVAPGGSRLVTVTVDFAGAPAGPSANRLIVGSTDADESPYPDAVHLIFDKAACYPLTRSRAGNGGLPVATPSSSPGCAPGPYHAGTAVQLTATPAIGWGVQSWSGTANDAGTALTNQVTMPAGPKAVSVTYLARCYALTRTHTGSGGDPVATPANSPGCAAGQYKYAEPIQLTASPAAGWRIGGWTHTAADASHRFANSLAMPAADTTVSVSYLEGLPNVLAVTEDFYDQAALKAALDSLGKIYELWDLDTSGTPELKDLALYPNVVWQTDFYGGLTAAEESLLASYLNGGGNLFLMSPRYAASQGLTPFNTGYLGLGFYPDYDYNYQITGVAAGPFAAFGSRYLDYSDYTDLLQPAATAQSALLNQYGDTIAISRVGPNYRTIYSSVPLDRLYGLDQPVLLGQALDFLGTIFADVPAGYWAKRWVDAMYKNGITSGCSANPRQYCPEAAVTRSQMAVFLLLAKEGAAYAPPPCASAPFGDVPASHPLCSWIQELARRGVTTGCGGGNYCPDSVVSRQQMAVFLLATQEGPGYTPAPCVSSSPFTDVAVGSPFCPWVAEVARRGITTGCGGGSFCASSPVNRAQMAVFLVTSFHLPLP